MVKVLLLTNTIAPYRIPVLNRLNTDNEIDLTVWYLEERERNRHWNINHGEIQYNYECLKGIHYYVQKMDLGVHINPGLFYKLVKFKPDVVMAAGYDSLAYWSALLYCKLFNKKYVVWWGSTLESSRVKNGIVNLIRRSFFKMTNNFVTYGTAAAECLKHYGVDSSRIVTGYNTVNIRYFYEEYKKYAANQSVKRNNTTQVNFLFIGQLIERKGVTQIIEALKTLDSKNWNLKIVGSGPDEMLLKQSVREYKLESQIHFEGYKQQEELTSYLLEADCLVFPSIIEVWGLVVNEAIATKTFVLSSKYAGATKDIIYNKRNGLVIDPTDTKNLIEGLQWVLSNMDDFKSNWKVDFSLWRKLHPYSYARSIKLSIKAAISGKIL
ncbi:glycosyltransferase family 4 protein [Paenibacillus spongiae]|uniref:Glycosyltransferase family 4 protein n=1 Tax=Paenibacillus spongiae TaxID=2909671 RepID=A0ABY5SCB4_9BACL|nr:glycosyltransferase family 4 protein [Paenibacillus spongiae]UVI31611.1 glycosyltransferase family 4 protein [Paenibacillus spongiae]